jgi:hypothetical protein
VTDCPECGVSFRVWRENQRVYRTHCHLHRGQAAPSADSRAVARLRRSWSSSDTIRLQPLPRPDLRDDDRVEHLRERQEAAEPWLSGVPLYEDEATGEDALLATLALHIPETAAA